jgi:hypothetical protein
MILVEFMMKGANTPGADLTQPLLSDWAILRGSDRHFAPSYHSPCPRHWGIQPL